MKRYPVYFTVNYKWLASQTWIKTGIDDKPRLVASGPKKLMRQYAISLNQTLASQ